MSQHVWRNSARLTELAAYAAEGGHEVERTLAFLAAEHPHVHTLVEDELRGVVARFVGLTRVATNLPAGGDGVIRNPMECMRGGDDDE